jgi:CheY-like chemotaxis protein
VTLLLPASDGAAPSTPRDDRAPAPAASIARARVLVVDDELNVRRSLGLLLRSNGHEFIECDRGHEALARCAAQRDGIDVAIVDMMMPDMTGRELVARLRAVRPGLPVIISSGYSASSDIEALLAEPGVTLLPKPYTTDELQRALLAALQGVAAADSRSAG